MFDTLFQLQELKYLYRLYKDIKIYLHEKAGHNIIHSFFPTKMSPPPSLFQNRFLFSPRRPSAQNLQAKSLIQIQKEI